MNPRRWKLWRHCALCDGWRYHSDDCYLMHRRTLPNGYYEPLCDQ